MSTACSLAPASRVRAHIQAFVCTPPMVCSIPMAGSRQHFSFAPSVVLYHAECADGFGAAWALWRRFPQARFLAVKHGVPPPDGLKGERVVIVDFSYAREL